MSAPLDALVPEPDARERFEITIQAPAEVVYDVCAEFDLQSIPLVRSIFWLRTRLMGSHAESGWRSEGLLLDAQRMGWGTVAAEPPRLFVAGAACQPWLADVVFRPLSAANFRAFAEPRHVKIAWTLEIEPLESGASSLATETRVVATDDEARRSFLDYWRWARFGIVSIRWLWLPAIRRRAEGSHSRRLQGTTP